MIFGCCAKHNDYQLVKNYGFDFVEVSGVALRKEKREVLNQFAESLLDDKPFIYGMNMFCGAELPIVGPDFSPDNTLLYAKDMISKAALLHIRQIVIGSPQARILPDGYSYEVAKKQAGEFLSICCEEASKYDINILFEPLNPRICNFMIGTMETFEFVTELNLQNLFMVLDFHHVIESGESFSDVVNVFSKVKHIHTNSVGADGKKYFPIEDEMKIYIDEFLLLKKTGYDGTVSIEAGAGCLEQDGERGLKVLRCAYDLSAAK